MSSCPGCANLSAKTYIIILSYPPTPVEEGGARKGVPSLRGQSRGGVRCSEPDFAQEMKEKFFLVGRFRGSRICTRNERKSFFSRDSEGAFGMESATPQTP